MKIDPYRIRWLQRPWSTCAFLHCPFTDILDNLEYIKGQRQLFLRLIWASTVQIWHKGPFTYDWKTAVTFIWFKYLLKNKLTCDVIWPLKVSHMLSFFYPNTSSAMNYIIWVYSVYSSMCNSDLILHANRLYLRKFAWTVKFYFLGKIRKVFQNVVCYSIWGLKLGSAWHVLNWAAADKRVLKHSAGSWTIYVTKLLKTSCFVFRNISFISNAY